ncbi:MAG: GAF domain-containing protein, partial [Deltaproteobacteria bacterium]|nr:GAF domain-containing protein [Deltaproteobacteria bacterium]
DPGKAAPVSSPWMAPPGGAQGGAGADPKLAEAARAQEARAAEVAKEREQAEAAARERAAAEAKAQAEAREAQERAAKAERAAAEARAQAERAAAEARAAAEERERISKQAREKAENEARATERARKDREAAERAAVEAKAQADAQENALRAARAAAEEKARADEAAKEKAEAETRARREAERDRAAAQEAERKAQKQQQRASASQESVKVVQAKEPKNRPPAQIGRDEQKIDHAAVEEILCELFERTPAAFDKKPEEALYYLLDLALEKIPSDSGSVYVADLNRRDLRFAAVRGPKAKDLLALDVRVPMGKGFVGFCAQEGVAIAISDAQRDPRFYQEISSRLGYETKSVLTTPVLQDGRALGAIQLINKRGSSSYTQAELSVLHYLAHQAALILELREG